MRGIWTFSLPKIIGIPLVIYRDAISKEKNKIGKKSFSIFERDNPWIRNVEFLSRIYEENQ